MRAVQDPILAAVVAILGVLVSAPLARAQDTGPDGLLGREEVYRQVTSLGGAIYYDTAATRGDRGDLWGSAYAGTYILAVVVRQPTPDGAGILHVYDPARTRYRPTAVFDHYDPSRRMSGQQAAAYRDATRHLYPASGREPRQANGGDGPGSTSAPVEPPSMGERFGRNVAAFRTAAGGGDALLPVVLVLVAVAVLVGAVATALVVVIPVLSSALARHRAISQAGQVLHNLRTGGRL